MGIKHTLYYDNVTYKYKHSIEFCKNHVCRAKYEELLRSEEETELEEVEDIEDRMYIL